MYATVDDVGDINDRDLKRLGIRNLAHRQKMLNSLLGVRAKRRQSMNLEGSYNYTLYMGDFSDRAFPCSHAQQCTLCGAASQELLPLGLSGCQLQ